MVSHSLVVLRLSELKGITRTYQLNWLFIVDEVLGRYFELPDDDKLGQLLMRIASMCLEQGIPLAHAQGFKPLTEEVRNNMTLRATELGLKAWDRNVNRFIDSTRIEQYDPVNT